MNIIDLFAGCGGMSTGFEMAGFNTVLAVEKDEWAGATYQHNHPNTKVHIGSITDIQDLNQLSNQYELSQNIDGIIGGPPCQGFSLSGNRDPKDPRNSLFMDYMRFVAHFKPTFFVMENVTGILSAKNAKGELVKELIIEVAKQHGYNTHIMTLLAADFGVPQMRRRVFFIGVRQDSNHININTINNLMHVKQEHITLWQAISDLPQIDVSDKLKENDQVVYTSGFKNAYQQWCREKSGALVQNHVPMKHSERIIERFKCIDWGQSVADVPDEHKQRKRGNVNEVSGKTYAQNNMRPHPDRPAPTLPASFQSNFIHPYLHRNFTAREGARLQSFPDHYVFLGKRTTMSWEKNLSQFQQIGNAVPPLLAYGIAKAIKEALKEK